MSTCLCGMIEHPLGIYPKMLLLSIEVGCFLIFWKITILISKGAVPICTPISNVGVFPLPNIFSSISCHQCFWSWTILTVVRWNLRVVSIWISLMAKDVEHFLKNLSAILDFSVESSLFRSVPHFLLGYLEFWCLISWVLYIYLEVTPLSGAGLWCGGTSGCCDYH